jgi:PPOX class probable F420-dependent enzyme
MRTTAISRGLEKLLSEPAYCQIATVMPDGSPQITQVWVDTDGEHILVNTGQHRQKVRNVERDPRVALNIVDPNDAWRIANMRGRVVEITTSGADDHIDGLAQKYLGAEKYPFRNPEETRVILKIAPERVNSVGLD